MRCLLFIMILFAGPHLFGQNKISYRQACEDIDYFFAKIDSIHPNMYWHVPKSRVDSFIKDIKRKCSRDSVFPEELGIWLKQCQHFFDYHTGISCTYNFYILKNKYLFPFVEINEDREIFFKNSGNKILSINGISSEELLRFVENTFGADLLPDNILFDINHSLLFQYMLIYRNIYPPYQVKIKNINDIDSMIYLKRGCVYDTLKCELDTFWAGFYEDYPYYVEFCPAASIAIIRYEECVKDIYQENFDKFLGRCFDKLKEYHISDLFIDVSRNDGGVSTASELFFPYLHIDKRHRMWAKITEKHTNKRGRTKLNTHWKWTALLRSHQGYKGNIYIYQSFLTCSAAPWLGKVLRTFNLAKLVGTETDLVVGNYSLINRFKLPNSNIAAYSARRYFENISPRSPLIKNGRLVPDIYYPFLENRKLDMNDCIKIVNQNK